MKMSKRFKIYGSIALMALALNWIVSSPSDSSLRSRVMKLTSERGLCSGEQVRAPSGVDYILTAAHCRPLADENGSIKITTEDGRVLMRRIVAEDPLSDLLLLEGVPGIKGLNIASYDMPREHVRTFTHGNRFNTYKTEGALIQDSKILILVELITTPKQEVGCSQPKNSILDLGKPDMKACLLNVYETVTTAMIVPGSSGGPVVNDSGELVGVVSAGGDSFGYLVRLYDIKGFIYNY